MAEFATDAKLLPKLRESLEQSVLKWRFKPVVIDGAPRMVRAKTRVVLAVNQVDGVYKVTVDNITFPNETGATVAATDGSPAQISGKRMTPPSWPRGLLGANVSGRVLLVVRVGADGRAEEAVAVQTMLLDIKGKDAVLRMAIAQFEGSALLAAKQWRFSIPAERGRMSAMERTISAPVDFAMGTRPAAELPGKWRTIVRAPKRKAEWLPDSSDEQSMGVSDVAAAAGEVMSASHLVKLETNVVGTDVL